MSPQTDQLYLSKDADNRRVLRHGPHIHFEENVGILGIKLLDFKSLPSALLCLALPLLAKYYLPPSS